MNKVANAGLGKHTTDLPMAVVAKNRSEVRRAVGTDLQWTEFADRQPGPGEIRGRVLATACEMPVCLLVPPLGQLPRGQTRE